ncbi:DUF4354 family protein [Candidatus Williamhamiltonella defendens]
MPIGRQQTYTKTFNVTLNNNTQQDIELLTLCLKKLRFEWKRI